MARISINQLTTFRWSLEEDLEAYRRAGVQGIGLWRQKLSDCGEEQAIELVAESGLAVSCLMWAGGFTGSDGRSYRESVADALEAIAAAAAVQAGCLVVYSGARGGHTHNHARRLLKSALGEIGPAAHEQGVTLAIEPMHADCAAGWTFLTSLTETLEVLEAVGDPHIKLTYDTYHLGQQEIDHEQLREITPRIALVQLGDAMEPPAGEQNRCQLGAGNVPLKEILATLRQGGYDGFLDVELMGEDVETIGYETLISDAKSAIERLLAE